LPVGNSEIAEAHRIKTLLNIQNDAYHSKGVGENDLLIIASCKIGRHDLVTDEKRQNNQPLELKKLKIPGVCALPSVSVNCVNFLEFMKRSGAMFG
jgi:Domain of unknown function (DUF4411)